MSYATNSLGKYSGTIVTSPIRPASPNENIATVFSNEVRGGHHNYETIAEMYAIIENRRDWGMLCTIYNDATSSNNKTYKLQYNFVNTLITDNNNWVEYNPSGSLSSSTEWIDSVQEIASSPTTFTEGYSYLVDSGIGSFSGKDDNIAIWSNIASTFSFVEPTQGMTLRVDGLSNLLYKYEGTYSSGTWTKEYINRVRYLSADSSNGLSYSATSSQSAIIDYDNSVYYVTFNATSSGTASINIDSIGDIYIKKLQNNTLSYIQSSDLIPGIKYQLIYNNGVLQTVLPNSSTTTIGAAEDGTYTDGVFTDFTPSTPIGTAIDRFNELLLYLAPPPAPNLSSWSALGSFVNGGISFDDTDIGFVGATGSPYGSVQRGGTFSNLDSQYRLGIMSSVVQPITGTAFNKDITGILNSDVQSTTSYAQYSFGDADQGTLSFLVNGVTISTIDLTLTTAVDTTSSGATSGISVSAPTSSVSESGYYFDLYKNRTGTFLLKPSNSEIVDGYNYFVIRHDTSGGSSILNQYEFIADSSTLNVVGVNPQISNVNSPFTRFLSGIEYYDFPMNLTYQSTLQNLVSNTYNQSQQAVEYKDLSTDISTPLNNVTNTETVSDDSITDPDSQYSPIVVSGLINPNSTMIASMTFSVNRNVRRINDSIGFGVDVLRTVQGTFSGATSTFISYPIDNWFVDTYVDNSTNTVEYFNGESYRLINFTDKYNSYHFSSDISANPWVSSSNLINNSTHKNGLQVINSSLVYPKYNFSQPGPGNTQSNPNYNIGGNRNYSNAFVDSTSGLGPSVGSNTNYRTYTRWFYYNKGYSNFTLRITQDGTTFVNADTALSGNSNVWVELKLPYGSGNPPAGTQSSGSLTGWMDATKPYQDGVYSDGRGCLSGTFPTTSGSDWPITFGKQSTRYSKGYVLLRITTSSDYTGNISKIELFNS